MRPTTYSTHSYPPPRGARCFPSLDSSFFKNPATCPTYCATTTATTVLLQCLIDTFLLYRTRASTGSQKWCADYYSILLFPASSLLAMPRAPLLLPSVVHRWPLDESLISLWLLVLHLECQPSLSRKARSSKLSPRSSPSAVSSCSLFFGLPP